MGSMTSVCTDCNFTFVSGPDGSRILSPALEFLRLGRGVPQELSDIPEEKNALQWPNVDENVNDLAPGCDHAIRRLNAVETIIDNPGWFHMSLGLLGESASNCVEADGEFMAGVMIELDRSGTLYTIAADIKDRDVCRSYSYHCAVERRLEAGDILRTFYWLDTIGTLGTTPTLPGSARNVWSIRTIRRA